MKRKDGVQWVKVGGVEGKGLRWGLSERWDGPKGWRRSGLGWRRGAGRAWFGGWGGEAARGSRVEPCSKDVNRVAGKILETHGVKF